MFKNKDGFLWVYINTDKQFSEIIQTLIDNKYNVSDGVKNYSGGYMNIKWESSSKSWIECDAMDVLNPIRYNTFMKMFNKEIEEIQL